MCGDWEGERSKVGRRRERNVRGAVCVCVLERWWGAAARGNSSNDTSNVKSAYKGNCAREENNRPTKANNKNKAKGKQTREQHLHQVRASVLGVRAFSSDSSDLSLIRLLVSLELPRTLRLPLALWAPIFSSANPPPFERQ